jgi:hypothetical protein
LGEARRGEEVLWCVASIRKFSCSLRETVKTFYKGVSSSSKGLVTVEGICGTLISLRSGLLGYLLKIRYSRVTFSEEAKQALNN